MIPTFSTPIKGLCIDNKLLLEDDYNLTFTSSNKNYFLIAQEIYAESKKNIPEILKNFISNPIDAAKSALNNGADMICYRINIEKIDNFDQFIENQQKIIQEIINETNLPVILGTLSTTEYKKEIISYLAQNIEKPLIFAGIEENNYKEIIPALLGTKHLIIARTPIDINLTKELNILIRDMGFPLEQIIIDPTAAALGYGMDYAYSIIERIRFAALNGDTTLNLPIISMCSEEVYRAKETKSEDFSESWGNLEDRALIWELATASAFISAGANIITLSNPASIRYLKKSLKEV